MNSHEEALQRDLEAGQIPKGDELDVKAYRQVFRSLEKDPGYELSGFFAERLVDRVTSRRESKDLIAYLAFAGGILVLAIAALATMLFIGIRFDRFDLGFLSAMAEYKGLAIFGIVFILFLNWLDKRVVKGSFSD